MRTPGRTGRAARIATPWRIRVPQAAAQRRGIGGALLPVLIDAMQRRGAIAR
jgi:hypothetical protein